jgi:YggT family protein
VDIILGNLLGAVALVLRIVLNFYMWLVIGRVIISWVNADPHNPIVRFLYNATEPVLYRVRRVLPQIGAGLDLSPMVVILGLYFLERFLVVSLYQLADRIGG